MSFKIILHQSASKMVFDSKFVQKEPILAEIKKIERIVLNI